MSKITLDVAENCACKLRLELQLSQTEPINVKTLLRMLRIVALYKPLSDGLYGLSVKSADERFRFMLINCNSTRGRQHFTVAHELYHLYYDPNPSPHFCNEAYSDDSERSANLFARSLLLPRQGLIKAIPDDELQSGSVSLTTILNLEALFGVSHQMLVIRLKELKLISQSLCERLMALKIKQEASLRGFDTDLYSKGNEGLVLGDFGAKARELFEKDLISEGHYVELLRKIGYGCGEILSQR